MKLAHRDIRERIRSNRSRGIAAMLVLAVILAACSGADSELASTGTTAPAGTPTPTEEAPGDLAGADVDSEAITTVDQSQLDSMPIGTLTQEETDGLMWMREEEKLAHDVYVALHDLWQTKIFFNIAEAETNHTDAVRALLERYELEDPAVDNPEGVFTNPEIQQLYDDLIARGSESLVDALTVGAMIEDRDIVDLQSLQTDKPDLAAVYGKLEKGSRNHMRAFISNLVKRGETFTPTFLSTEAFETIISAPTERGPG